MPWTRGSPPPGRPRGWPRRGSGPASPPRPARRRSRAGPSAPGSRDLSFSLPASPGSPPFGGRRAAAPCGGSIHEGAAARSALGASRDRHWPGRRRTKPAGRRASLWLHPGAAAARCRRSVCAGARRGPADSRAVPPPSRRTCADGRAPEPAPRSQPGRHPVRTTTARRTLAKLVHERLLDQVRSWAVSDLPRSE